MSTEEEIGYRDAIRQVQKVILRRLKLLQEEYKEALEERQAELHYRILELQHILEVVESLHR